MISHLLVKNYTLILFVCQHILNAEMKITLQHARSYPCRTQIGFCSPVMKKFAERHNLDWNAFITEGVDEEVLLATGDAMVKKLVAWVKSQNPG